MIKRVTAIIPVTNIEASIKFYTEKVGLKKASMGNLVMDSGLLEAGDGTHLFLYERPPAKSEHTLASLTVDNIEEAIDELSAKGIVFEQYDLPNGLKTNEKGIAEIQGTKSAWFKDPDGNILSLFKM